jgi:hypothetical protein
MRKINWFATAAAGALVLAGVGVVWTNSSTERHMSLFLKSVRSILFKS